VSSSRLWSQGKCSLPEQPPKPIKWLGKGCDASISDGSGGCKTFCSCNSILCKNLCLQNGCNWDGLSCLVRPLYFDACAGITQSPTMSPTATCFPGSARFRKPDGSFGLVSEIRIGDLVPAADMSQLGEISYVPVLSFQHVDRLGNYSFVRIEHEFDVVVMTDIHRVFVSYSPLEKPHDVMAAEVDENMYLWYQGKQGLEPARVLGTSEVKRQGVFSFFTPLGNILIENGTLASVFSWHKSMPFPHQKAVTLFSWQNSLLQHLGLFPTAVWGELPADYGHHRYHSTYLDMSNNLNTFCSWVWPQWYSNY